VLSFENSRNISKVWSVESPRKHRVCIPLYNRKDTRPWRRVLSWPGIVNPTCPNSPYHREKRALTTFFHFT
jgi:hypothetical protein